MQYRYRHIGDDWVVDSIYTLVRPTPNFYTRWTTAIHGLTAEDTNDALCFEEAWESIAPKLKDLPLVAHNSPFDEGCLKAAHEVYDLAIRNIPSIALAVSPGRCTISGKSSVADSSRPLRLRPYPTS